MISVGELKLVQIPADKKIIIIIIKEIPICVHIIYNIYSTGITMIINYTQLTTILYQYVYIIYNTNSDGFYFLFFHSE
jgi:hypothetical protein